MNFKKYGFCPSTIPKDANGIPARITAVNRERYEFVCEAGTGLAHLKAGMYYAGDEAFPTTGDFVMLDWQSAGESRILQTLSRKSFFARLDPSSSGHGAQAVAANFDYVFILQSLDRDFNPRRLERYLTLAWSSGAVPVVLLTKADRVSDDSSWLRAAGEVAVEVDVLAISSKTAYGIDQLGKYLLPGTTIVLLGSSGVGKSSLINALAGKEMMETAEIREKDGRGRHTTTRRQLLLLKSGVMVIDTPGMRELGMWDAEEGLSKSFSDIEQYFGNCKFRDCKHLSEPGCAVKAAIQFGELSQSHWENYLKLRNENQIGDNKAGYLRAKEQRFKEIAKFHKTSRKNDYRNEPCNESFICKVCSTCVVPEDAGSQHRNHCPCCLSSIHIDNKPGDRASLCKGIMEPIGMWVRKNGEWAIIHRCRSCGILHSNRIAADDNSTLLMSIAVKPLAQPPFPLWSMGESIEVSN